ncbi:unnamed protein product, partial [Mesocestoides corti]
MLVEQDRAEYGDNGGGVEVVALLDSVDKVMGIEMGQGRPSSRGRIMVRCGQGGGLKPEDSLRRDARRLPTGKKYAPDRTRLESVAGFNSAECNAKPPPGVRALLTTLNPVQHVHPCHTFSITNVCTHIAFTLYPHAHEHMNYLIGRSSGGGGHTETAGHFTLTHNHHHQSTTHLAGTLPHRAGATSSDSTIATVLLFTLHPSSQRHPIPLHVPSSSVANILPKGCNACKQGLTCDLPYNNPPEFSALEYLVRPRLQDYTQKVAQLIATDMDLCTAPNAPPADCQVVEYLIAYDNTE